MALRVEYEDEAQRDIIAAARFARSRFGEQTADRLLTRIRGLSRTLANHPDMGLSVDIPTHPRLSAFQFFPVSDFPYLIFFRREEDALRIYGVVYEAMDLPRVFRDREWSG